MGTWEVARVFGEELEMHKIELNHNVLGCQDCCHEKILGKSSLTFFAKIFVTSKPINMF